MARDYFQDALTKFNDTNGVNWYGWKTHDDEGNKIPNDQRMQYKYIKIIKDGATMPSEAEVNAKIQEIKDADKARADAKTSAINKLKGATYSALTDAEAKALFGA